MTDLLRQISRNYRDRERVERLKRVSASFIRAAGASVTRGGLTFDVSPEIGVADSGDRTFQTNFACVWMKNGYCCGQSYRRIGVAVAAPRAEDQLRRSLDGPRYDRATPAERRYMHAMAAVGVNAVPTSDVAPKLGRRQSDVSVQRDGLSSQQGPGLRT